MSSPARDRPCAAMMPNSAQCPRNALISIVRCQNQQLAELSAASERIVVLRS